MGLSAQNIIPGLPGSNAGVKDLLRTKTFVSEAVIAGKAVPGRQIDI
ncbi:hypothetical protein [Pedobacter hartonius]|nr:hypothetical protein [Pedobacter hartonius]